MTEHGNSMQTVFGAHGLAKCLERGSFLRTPSTTQSNPTCSVVRDPLQTASDASLLHDNQPTRRAVEQTVSSYVKLYRGWTSIGPEVS